MNINTTPLNMQVSPLDIMRGRMDAKMYQPQNLRGPFFYGAPAKSLSGMRGLRGMGDVDVSALATNFPRGRGSYVQNSYLQFPGYPVTNLTPDCLDDATSAALAALIPGASVVKLPAENMQATNGLVPLCNWIQTPEGIVRAADLYAVASENCAIPGLTAACCFQQLLADAIPGGVMGGGCAYQAGYSNPLIQQFPQGSNPQLPADPVYIAPIITTPTQPTQQAAASPVFQFMNLTTGQQITSGGQFHVGDSFQILISGAAPNANVTVSANQNGQSSSSVIGKTSAGGSFQTSGTMNASTAGNWVEQWQVPAGSGVSALTASVSFSVIAPITTPVLPTTGVTLPSTGTSTPITSTTSTVNAVAMTCADVASQIAVAQAGGMSNAQILALFQGAANSQYANCPAVLALQPSTTSNTMLYVGIAAAALLLLSMGRS